MLILDEDEKTCTSIVKHTKCCVMEK